ncbi:MAG: hypothetical protein JWL80_637 [Parcubacteria group bacterium]|nr:hypothetical protein [Parcubacteria group bacterium]
MDEQTKLETRRLFKWGSWVVIMLGLFLLAQTLVALKAWQGPSAVTNAISVNGTGEAYAVPDVAAFSFSVSADAKNVADAQTSVTTKMNAIVDALKAMNVDEKDIQTNDYSINPKYIYQSSVCTVNSCPPSRQIADGYTVIHGVMVKVRKTDDAGKALAAVGDKGATNVSGLSFTTNDPNQGLNEARAKAIDDAKAKAEALADQLGVRLVRVVGYYDTASSPYPMYDSAVGGQANLMKVTAVAPSLPVGQNKITANVTVNYEIR